MVYKYAVQQVEIPIITSGDLWFNHQEVYEKVAGLSKDIRIVLDLQSEAPSLHSIGLVTLFSDLAVDPDLVYVTRWANPVEQVPFKIIDRPKISYFFWHSQGYDRAISTTTARFDYGMFCGRRTWARCGMVYDAFNSLADRCLFSVMNTKVPLPWQRQSLGIDLEAHDAWLSQQGQQWWENCPIVSLDNSSVGDHYADQESDYRLNKNILDHYHDFKIEIVMETFCRGDTFLPTEKTVRALLAGKAMIVYGPRYFLQRLRNLGFKTWNTCWDESYDELEGHARWVAMSRVLQQSNAVDPCIAQHNQNTLKDVIGQYGPK